MIQVKTITVALQEDMFWDMVNCLKEYLKVRSVPLDMRDDPYSYEYPTIEEIISELMKGFTALERDRILLERRKAQLTRYRKKTKEPEKYRWEK